jgi:DNA-nicking Smr family endonuclease
VTKKNTSSHRPFKELRRPTRAHAPSAKTFVEAMTLAGTVPLGESVRRIPPSRSVRSRAPATPRAAPAFHVERDEDFVEGYRADLGADMRRRLGGTPMATLDLHRLDTDAARRRLASFLATVRAKGRALVLIIVGRGRHSVGGRGVLRAEIAGWLTALPVSEHVLGFRTAPRELGGSGGIVVLLARTARSRRG